MNNLIENLEGRKYDNFVLFLAAALCIYLDFRLKDAIVLLVLVYWILKPQPYERSAKLAFFCLLSSGFLTFFGKSVQSEYFAILSYFFLVVTVCTFVFFRLKK